MDQKTIAQPRFAIGAVGYLAHTFAGHLDQVRTDIDARNVITKSREEFAQPSRAASYVEDACAGRQSQRDGHIGEVAKVPVGVRVQTFARPTRMFVGQIVERLCQQVMAIAGPELVRILDCPTLVIKAFKFFESHGNGPYSRLSSLRQPFTTKQLEMERGRRLDSLRYDAMLTCHALPEQRWDNLHMSPHSE